MRKIHIFASILMAACTTIAAGTVVSAESADAADIYTDVAAISEDAAYSEVNYATSEVFDTAGSDTADAIATTDASVPVMTDIADTASETEKGSPDTGVETGVPVACGIAAIAAGALIVAKKKN